MTKKTITETIEKMKNNFFKIIVVVIIIGLVVYFSNSIFPKMFREQYGESVKDIGSKVADALTEVAEEEKPEVKHIETPVPVKALYMTACFAGTPSLRETIVTLADETEINSIIIDIKDYSGTISFNSGNPDLAVGEAGEGCGVSDMKEFVEYLHSKNIYVIGRITVFQDPLYTKTHPELAVKKESDGSVWKDYKGISFVEVGARPYWDYIVTLAEESYNMGFDELNFDYVRFPSDGNMKDIYFPFSNDAIVADPQFGKAKSLEKFFKYLDEKMDELGVVTSADLFGMTTTNTDDLNIGQVLEYALPYFDYIAPMVYPSHYPPGFNGYADPNDYPYEVVHLSMGTAVDRINTLLNSTSTPESVKEHVNVKQLRTWIQDFDYGGIYDVPEVKAQIQATYDVGLDSWMIWAPSNRYTRGALVGE